MSRDVFFTEKNKESFSIDLKVSNEVQRDYAGRTQREQRTLDGNGYDEEALNKENTLLARRLADQTLRNETDERFRERSVAIDMTRIVRNKAILLYQDGVASTDSETMQNVKRSLKELDNLLRSPVTDDYREVFTAYDKAIGYMTDYELTKNPFFPAGKRRKRKVVELRDAIRQERARLQEKIFSIQGEIPEDMKVPLNVLEGAHIHPELNGGPIEDYTMRKRKFLSMQREGGEPDGPEMRQVKIAYKELGACLEGPISKDQAAYGREENNIKTSFRNVINACNSYVRTHNPRSAEGKERLQAIKDLKKRCELEREYMLSAAKKLIKQNTDGATWEQAFGTASKMADEYFNGRDMMEKVLGEKPSVRKILKVYHALSSLTDINQGKYRMGVEELIPDYLTKHLDKTMLDDITTERYRLIEALKKTFDRLKACPVPRAFLKNPDDDPMDENLRAVYARLRIMSDPVYKLYEILNELSLTLTFGVDQQESKFKDNPEEIGKIYRDIGQKRLDAMSPEDKNYVDNILSSNAEAISGEKYTNLNKDAVNDYLKEIKADRIAEAKANLSTILTYEYMEYKKGDEVRARKAFNNKNDEILMKEVEDILSRAESLGVHFDELTDSQKANIRRAGLDNLGSVTMSALEDIKKGIEHFGEEAVNAYNAKVGELYSKAGAYAVLRLSRVSSFGEDVAEYELSKFISESILELGGKQALKELSEKMYVSELSAGAGGILDFVEEKEWQDKDAANVGATLLANLCDTLKELYQLQGKAISDGLTPTEAERLLALGTEADKVLKDPESMESMELTANGLDGYRFKAGFAKIKALVTEGFSFKDACKRIGAETLLPPEEQEKKAEQKEETEEKEDEIYEEEEELKLTDEIIGTAKVLDMREVASVVIENMTDKKMAKALTTGVIELQKILRELKPNTEVSRNIIIGDTTFTLIQHEDGSMDLMAPKFNMPLSESASIIADQLEADIVANVELYGKKDALRVILDAEKKGDLIAESKLRGLCLHSLEGTMGLPSSYFTNIPTVEIVNYAKQALQNTITKEQIRNRVESLEDSSHINGEQTLNLLNALEKDAAAGNKVSVREPQVEVKLEEQSNFTEDEVVLKNFIANLLFGSETWTMDTQAMSLNSGERIKKLFTDQKVVAVLVKLIQNRYNHTLDDLLEKLPIEDPELKQGIKQVIDEFIGDKELTMSIDSMKDVPEDQLEEEYQKLEEEYKKKQFIKGTLLSIRDAGFEGLGRTPLRDKIITGKMNFYLHGIPNDKYEEIARKISEYTNSTMSKLQDMVNEKIELVFNGGGGEEEEEHAEQEAQKEEGNVEKQEEQQEEVEDQEVQNEVHEQQEEQKEKAKAQDDDDDVEMRPLVLNMEKPKSPDAWGISETEKNRRKQYLEDYRKASAQVLGKVIAENFVTGKRGQGKFLRLILSKYFNGVSEMDKRAMLASAIRGAKGFYKLPENATKDEKEKNEKRKYADFLGGLFKGAGPLLQKLLQGLPIQSMPEELQGALSDMKSKLAPIPEQIVKAELLDIVKRSEGRVTKIELNKSLGAASVGQAFLCRMYGPKFPDGKDVVVKLLRPDVRNRMMREKAIMLDCAKLTDKTGGMEKTYLGQLKRIEEELDLTLEARNVEKGAIYNKYTNNVKSMKLDKSVDPTATCMVLEKAKGTTLDSYMKEVKKLHEDTMARFISYEKQIIDGKEQDVPIKVTENGKTFTKLELNTKNSGYLLKARQALRENLKELQIRQDYMTDLAYAWVTEGIFKNGFYHGDLHSGNIMIDHNSLTVIDFGNATKLSDAQLNEITKMMLAAASGVTEDYEAGFHKLLTMSGASETFYQENRQKLLKVFSEVMALGDVTTTGERIASSLIRAQELGFAIPPEIFNFSQSQLRLQNAIDEMNSLILEMQQDIELLDKMEGAAQYAPKLDMIALCQMQITSGQSKSLGTVTTETKDHFEYKDDVAEIKKKFETEEPNKLSTYIFDNFDFGNKVTSAKDNVSGLLNSLLLQKQANHPEEQIQHFKELLLEQAEESFDDIKQVMGSTYGEEFRNDILECLDHFTEPEYQERFKKRLKDLEDHPMIKLISDTYSTAMDYVEAKKNGESEEVLKDKRDIVLENYRNQQFYEKVEQGDIFRGIKALMFMESEAASITTELTPYFEDTKHKGALLKKTYNEFRKAQKEKGNNSPLTMAKYSAFFKVYYDVMKTLLSEQEETMKEQVDKGTPMDFLSVMGSVIGANMKAAVRRMGGIFGVISKMFSYSKLAS